MSKSPAWAIDLQKFVFRGQAIGWANAGSLYVSLHTDDPAYGGSQTASEVGYKGYARAAVPRTASAWNITGAAVTNAAVIELPASAGPTQTATHFGIGTAANGAGVLLYSGPLEADLVIAAGIQPRFSPGRLKVEEEMT